MCDEISYSLVASESKLILYTLEIDNNKNLIQIEIGDDFYLKIKAKEVDIIQAINNSKKSFNKKRNNNKFNYIYHKKNKKNHSIPINYTKIDRKPV